MSDAIRRFLRHLSERAVAAALMTMARAPATPGPGALNRASPVLITEPNAQKTGVTAACGPAGTAEARPVAPAASLISHWEPPVKCAGHRRACGDFAGSTRTSRPRPNSSSGLSGGHRSCSADCSPATGGGSRFPAGLTLRPGRSWPPSRPGTNGRSSGRRAGRGRRLDSVLHAREDRHHTVDADDGQ